jgi:hypothetical protein
MPSIDQDRGNEAYQASDQHQYRCQSCVNHRLFLPN